MHVTNYIALLVALIAAAADAGTEKTLPPTSLRTRPPMDAPTESSTEAPTESPMKTPTGTTTETPNPSLSPTEPPSKPPILGEQKAICVTEQDCANASVELGLALAVDHDDSFPTKGCFYKIHKNDVAFFSPGTAVEMSTHDLPGRRVRLYCGNA